MKFGNVVCLGSTVAFLASTVVSLPAFLTRAQHQQNLFITEDDSIDGLAPKSSSEDESWISKMLLEGSNLFGKTSQGALSLLDLLNHEEDNELRMIMLLQTDEAYIVSESDKLKLKREGIPFMDITNSYDDFLDLSNEGNLQSINDFLLQEETETDLRFTRLTTKKNEESPKGKPGFAVPIYNYPNASEFHEKEVTKLFPLINQTSLFAELSVLSSFFTRYYKSEEGVESTMWLFGELLGLSSLYHKNENSFNVSLYRHEDFLQPSIIFKLYGKGHSDADLGEDIIVVGCHLDSINLLLPTVLRAPGADDNGSGVVTVMEAIRILLKKDITFKNTIIFHFHAAEEGGLLGSGDIFKNYRKNNLPVRAMLQQDMTGYIKKSIDEGVGEHFGIVTESVSPYLTKFTKELIRTYCSIPYLETEFNHATSDHASAFINGFPSAFVSEAKFELMDPYVHSVWDTIEKLDFNHMEEHVKLVLSFVYELGMFQDF